MKNKIAIIVSIIASLLAMTTLLGCVAFSKAITPATLDNNAIAYTGNPPDEYRSFIWPNLADVEKLSADVDSTHQLNTLAWQQKIDTDKLKYSQIKAVVAKNRQLASQLEQNLFGDQGMLTIGLSALGFGLPAGLLGLMRKRPQDITPEEFKTALIEAGLKNPDDFKKEQGLG
jgi:hypothetical protein